MYIPKPGNKRGRPLGISNFEDKLVELAVKRVLEPIYEEVFEESSYGYRPNRNRHKCLFELGRTIQQKRVNFIVEADIQSFFDKVNHEWMLQFLGHRVGDPREYVDRATELLFKWINRKSQRKAYTWDGFKQAQKWVKWPEINVRKELSPLRRAEAH